MGRSSGRSCRAHPDTRTGKKARARGTPSRLAWSRKGQRCTHHLLVLSCSTTKASRSHASPAAWRSPRLLRRSFGRQTDGRPRGTRPPRQRSTVGAEGRDPEAAGRRADSRSNPGGRRRQAIEKAGSLTLTPTVITPRGQRWKGARRRQRQQDLGRLGPSVALSWRRGSVGASR